MRPETAATQPQARPATVVGAGHERPPRDRRRALLRWQWERLREGRPPNPPPDSWRIAEPLVAAPRAERGELRAIWVGHATVLLQVGGLNVLTDPVWSDHASPIPGAGPRRMTPPALPFERLPPIDVVLLSHDHYDHLDVRTARALHRREGDRLLWAVPVGYRRWLARLGIRSVLELAWWRSAAVRTAAGELVVHALPARHWSQRRPGGAEHRSWGSWAVEAGGRRAYFGGDSGYFGGFAEIGRAHGPFDVALLPIGAYEPRWFMKSAHMNPEEAVRAYLDLGGAGAFLGIHWATFRLTDEAPAEPPGRARDAWRRAGLDPTALHVGPPGESLIVPAGERAGRRTGVGADGGR
ncbi:MAG TPA: MBL fold metallo-hydrolase [Longimicrobiales bacterium]|nr:MBL fold metallo-hydrolase [Longimicrobiales bacterium]